MTAIAHEFHDEAGHRPLEITPAPVVPESMPAPHTHYPESQVSQHMPSNHAPNTNTNANPGSRDPEKDPMGELTTRIDYSDDASSVSKSRSHLFSIDPDTASASTSTLDTIEYPEGGWTAWGVVLGSWCAMIVTFGLSNSMGTIQAWLLTHQLIHYSETQIAWIFSIWLFCMFMGGVWVGPLFDNYGIRVLLLPASVCYVMSIFILAWCKQYYQFVLGFSVLGGLSASAIFNPSITVIGHWFYKRRSLAMGLAVSGGAIGGILFPLSLDPLFKRLGYAGAIRVVGYIILFLLVAANLLLQSRKLKKVATFRDNLVDFTALKDARYLFTVLGIFMIEWAFFVPVNFIVVYAIAENYDAVASNQLLAYLNAASVLGRAIPGYLADKLGPFNMMTLMNIMSGIVALAVWIPAGHTYGGLIAFSVLFGFFSGTALSLAPVCVGQISDTREYGKRYGTCYFICSFATLTGLPISGALTGDRYLGLIIFSGVVFIISGMSFGIARFIGGRNVLFY